MEESDMRNHLEALDSEDRRCEVAHKALRGIMEQIQRTREELTAEYSQGAAKECSQKEWEAKSPDPAQSSRQRSYGMSEDIVYPAAPASAGVETALKYRLEKCPTTTWKIGPGRWVAMGLKLKGAACAEPIREDLLQITSGRPKGLYGNLTGQSNLDQGYRSPVRSDTPGDKDSQISLAGNGLTTYSTDFQNSGA
jgi:hypothetical protein